MYYIIDISLGQKMASVYYDTSHTSDKGLLELLLDLLDNEEKCSILIGQQNDLLSLIQVHALLDERV